MNIENAQAIRLYYDPLKTQEENRKSLYRALVQLINDSTDYVIHANSGSDSFQYVYEPIFTEDENRHAAFRCLSGWLEGRESFSVTFVSEFAHKQAELDLQILLARLDQRWEREDLLRAIPIVRQFMDMDLEELRRHAYTI